ncbi:MAG: flagellar filament capping protein FliD [Myxococcota bacterium]|nr:flagellar filament capping protein FliD [Myxococcota bacterium]
MGFGVDGLVSGMDTTALIDGMVHTYSAPQRQLQEKLDDTEDRKSKLSTLVNKIDAFEDALKDLDSESEFKAFTGTTTSEVYEASVNNFATAGSYDVEVMSLAKSSTFVSRGYSHKDGLVGGGDGSLTITYDGETTTIDFDTSSKSLEDLSSEINDIEGVMSYVLDTGDDSESKPYRLVIQGEVTGSDAAVTVTEVAGWVAPPAFTEQVEASDAHIQVSGVDVYSEDNSFTNAIPGTTITALEVSSDGADTLTIAQDNQTIYDNVNTALSAYNDIITMINTQTVYNDDVGIRGAFVGDSTVRRVQQSLQQVVTKLYSSGDTLNALSQMGVSTTSDGTLEFNQSDFEDALDTYYDDVEALFVSDDGFVAEAKTLLDVFIDPVDGTLETYKDSLDERIQDLEDQVSAYNTRITEYEERLRDQFNTMESLLGTMTGTQSYLSALFGKSSDD